MILTLVSLKLWSHAKSCLQTNFSRLSHRCELVTLNDQFTKEKCKFDPIWERNSPCKSRFNTRFTDFEGKKPRGLFFFNRSQTHRETSELRNSSELPRKFPEIFGNSRIIFGNSGTRQEKNLKPLAQKKLAGILSRFSLLFCTFWCSQSKITLKQYGSVTIRQYFLRLRRIIANTDQQIL